MSSSTGSSATAPASVAHQLYAVLATALFAAVLGYLVHHLPPLRDHPVAGVALALTVAGGAAIAVGGLLARRPPYELPAVLVATADGPDIRQLSRSDLAFCAALHAEALPHGFFAGLGTRFLRAYYATYVDSPHAIALGSTVAGQPVGYLVGVVNPAAHRAWILRNRAPALALRGAVSLALSPRATYRFLRTRLATYVRSWRRTRGARSDEPATAERIAVLTHVAILPGARSVGAGRRLVAAFEDEARRRGASRAVLTTLVGDGGAGDFYARLGWTLAATRGDRDGRRIEEWARALGGAAP